MRIRTTTDPHRIEWKEKVGDRWVGRTVSITRRNLRRFGVSCPPEGKPITEKHEMRLQVAVQIARRDEADGDRRDEGRVLLLRGAVDQYLDHDQVTRRRAQKREQVLRRPACSGPSVHSRSPDISLVGFLGDLPVDQVSGEDLTAYQRHLAALDYSPVSVRDYLLVVRAFFRFLVGRGLLADDPTGRLHLPPAESGGGVHFLTSGQVDALLDAVGDPLQYDPQRRLHLMREGKGRHPFLPSPGNNVLSLALPGFLYLGVRLSEFTRVHWEDVDLERRVVTIRGARKNQARVERRREVPLMPELATFLAHRPRTCDRAFTNSEGNPWTIAALRSAMRRFRAGAGSKLGFDFDYQTLRRTFGSILYASREFSLDQIAEFLGHANARTTRTWYAALRAEDHHDAFVRAFRRSS